MNAPRDSHAVIRGHIQSGRLEQARVALLRAIQQSPRDVDAHSMMCFVLGGMGRHAQALYYARRADELAPGDPNLLNNLAKFLHLTGDIEGAIAAFRRALAADPDHHSSLAGLTNVLNAGHRFDESEAVCRAALARRPGHAWLMANLSVSLLQSGRPREAAAVLKEAARLHPDDPVIATGLPHTLNYAGDSDPAETFEAHRAYGRLMARMYPGRHEPPRPDPDPDRRLRLGILSGDLRSHAVGFFAEPLLEHLDGGAFDIVCYSTSTAEDATTDRLRRHAAAWRNPVSESIPQLAAMIRRDRIDILLDLSGHTGGHRLPVLHLRPAPVQVTYFGYPNTTGVDGCDYRIVDSLTDPRAPEYDALATERLWRLDPCFLCYRPLPGAPEVAPSPSVASGTVTFGSFNALAKLDELTIDLYARTLAAVSGSRLLLKYHGLGSAAVRGLIAGRLAAGGVPTDRVTLDPPGKSAAEMLAAYGRMDVMLDSFPYHGTTTTCEALYMGVPVVTLEGRVCAARVGVSILTAAGHPEWVARSPEEYARIAAGLVTDPARLAAVRAGLRPGLLASPVCDAPAFAARFGAALRAMWRERARG